MPKGKGTYGSKKGRPPKKPKNKPRKDKGNMSLYRNINARKKAGTSRSKKKSTISAKNYRNMKAGFPKKKR